MLENVNWLAAIVGTIGYQVLGAAWYGPLFGGIWMDAMGFDSAEEVGDEDPTMGYLLTAAGALVATVSLAILVDAVGAGTWLDGLALGSLVGVGFVATTALQAVPFEGRAWPVYLVNAGYNVVALSGIGVLLAVW